MRSFFVEFFPESVEPDLLSSHRRGRRAGRFLLERLVHALVPSVLMPRRIHQMDRRLSLPMAVVAKGTPLSERMILGRPYSMKSLRNTGFAPICAVEVRPLHPRMNREKPSVAVRG